MNFPLTLWLPFKYPLPAHSYTPAIVSPLATMHTFLFQRNAQKENQIRKKQNGARVLVLWKSYTYKWKHKHEDWVSHFWIPGEATQPESNSFNVLATDQCQWLHPGSSFPHLPQMLAADLASETLSHWKSERRGNFSLKTLISSLNIRHCIGIGDK